MFEKFVNTKTIKETIDKYPEYKVFWRSGLKYRGAVEKEDDKQPRKDYVNDGFGFKLKMCSFEERMQRRYNWAAAIKMDINHNAKEIHLNGYSENDLY